MNTLKKVWLTEWDEGSENYTLTLESSDPSQEHRRVRCKELLFPLYSTENTRRTMAINLLKVEDLIMIADAIWEEVGRANARALAKEHSKL